LMAANLRKLRLRKTEKERTQKFYSYWIKFLGIFETCVTASFYLLKTLKRKDKGLYFVLLIIVYI
ncbi:hypothetical protein EKN08_08045, partial [Facklamia hominis]